MTVDVVAWRKVLDRITCGGPIPMQFHIVVPDGAEVAAYLQITAVVPDVTNRFYDNSWRPWETEEYRAARVKMTAPTEPPEMTNIYSTFVLAHLGEPSVHQVYRCARWFYVHELTEWFAVDGQPLIAAHFDGKTEHTRIDDPDGLQELAGLSPC